MLTGGLGKKTSFCCMSGYIQFDIMSVSLMNALHIFERITKFLLNSSKFMQAYNENIVHPVLNEHIYNLSIVLNIYKRVD